MATAGIQAILLAGGKSSRFNTETTKLSFTLCGQEIIVYPAKLFAQMNIPTTLVVGFQKQIIKKIITDHAISNISFVEQKEQRGTGHALLCTKDYWHAENILVMNADIPLINQESIEALITKHTTEQADLTFIISQSSDPAASGYGRVVQNNKTIEIVEEKHYTGEYATFPIINAGIYIINRAFLESTIKQLQPHEVSQEIYITDLVKLASTTNKKVATSLASFDTIRGINTLKELWAAEHIKRSELITYWMSKGVRFATALNVCLDTNVTIGSGTYIGNGVTILSGTSIGSHCHIDSFSHISNSKIHDHVTIKSHSVMSNSEIFNHAIIGPFAHLEDSTVKPQAIVGNFVEIKRSTIGQKSKAKHLSYLGDTIIEELVTIGAGTITCNYDGVNKHATTIKQGAFIGSNASLIAPITIGHDSIVAAGSIITDCVPDNALAIGRSRQINKEQYAHIIRTKLINKKNQLQSPTPDHISNNFASNKTDSTTLQEI